MSALTDLVRRRRRFLLFCAVGASGVVVNLAAFSLVLLLWPGADSLDTAGAGSLPTNVAGFVGWVVSVLTNFVLNDRFTFDAQIDRDGSTWQRRLGRYYVSAVVTLVLQLAVLNGMLWLLTKGPMAATLRTLTDASQASDADTLTQLSARVFGLITTYVRAFSNLCGIAVGTVINYVMSKKWVFK